jgi:hypothetical protein
MRGESTLPDPGLCEDCVHARVVVNRRGSRFHLCERSKHDPAFPRYPRLPVLRCPGHERRDAPGDQGAGPLSP